MNYRNFILLSGVTALLMGMTACSEKESNEPVNWGALDNEIIVSRASGTYELEVHTNGSYHVETLDEADWLTLTANKPSNNVAVIELQYEANDSFSRMASFTVNSDADKTRCDTVYVKQRGDLDPILHFEEVTTFSVAGAGGENGIPVVTNVPFEDMTVEIDYVDENAKDWITDMSIAATTDENRTLTVNVAQNTDELPRSAVVTLSYPDSWETGTLSTEITLLQYNADERSFLTITFDELLSDYATGEPIYNYVGVDGIIVSNKDNGNAGQPLHTDDISIDYSPTAKTIYCESEDGGRGIAIYADSEEDNVFEQYDKVTLLLVGATISVKENPTRYELTGFKPSSMVFGRESGSPSDVPVKTRTIGTLTDDDLYTYVTLTDVELPIRKGGLFPVDGGFNSASNTERITKYPLLVRDKDGNDMYMLTNDKCSYHRDGTRLPNGSGSLHGVVVHEHFSRYEWGNGLGFLDDVKVEELYGEQFGNIGTYQLRHQTKEDVWEDMNDDFDNGFSALLCEYRYRVVSNGNIVPSYGSNGWLSHTYQDYTNPDDGTHLLSGDETYDYLGPCGTKESTFYGANFGNRNGLGIVIDTSNENTSYESDRFATNSDGETELACDRASNSYCGYGTSGWSESNAENGAYVNVPNYGSSDNRGKGHVSGNAHLDFPSHYWWDDSTNTPYGYLICVNTSDVNSTIVSMQLCMRAVTPSYTPRYWCAEWSESDDQSGSNTWSPIGEFTLPDACYWKASGGTTIWSLPAAKPVNLTLPSSILGKSSVYIRIRPTSDLCSSRGDYTDAQLSNSESGKALAEEHNVSLTYFAIRYNK